MFFVKIEQAYFHLIGVVLEIYIIQNISFP
jgi:hypothetical protein